MRDHELKSHSHLGHLLQSIVPFKPVLGPPRAPLPKVLPAYLAVTRKVCPPRMSNEWHAKLGPYVRAPSPSHPFRLNEHLRPCEQVLGQIFGGVNADEILEHARAPRDGSSDGARPSPTLHRKRPWAFTLAADNDRGPSFCSDLDYNARASYFLSINEAYGHLEWDSNEEYGEDRGGSETPMPELSKADQASQSDGTVVGVEDGAIAKEPAGIVTERLGLEVQPTQESARLDMDIQMDLIDGLA
jgi:hypothetical protein